MREPTSSVTNREARMRGDRLRAEGSNRVEPSTREKKVRPPRRDKHQNLPLPSLDVPRMECTPWLELISDRKYTSPDQR